MGFLVGILPIIAMELFCSLPQIQAYLNSSNTEAAKK
jgi:hypothetical protein